MGRIIHGTIINISYFSSYCNVLFRPFAYKSCSNGKSYPSIFAGHMDFVPGSIAAPTGSSFSAHLEPFLLSIPDFIY